MNWSRLNYKSTLGRDFFACNPPSFPQKKFEQKFKSFAVGGAVVKREETCPDKKDRGFETGLMGSSVVLFAKKMLEEWRENSSAKASLSRPL